MDDLASIMSFRRHLCSGLDVLEVPQKLADLDSISHSDATSAQSSRTCSKQCTRERAMFEFPD